MRDRTRSANVKYNEESYSPFKRKRILIAPMDPLRWGRLCCSLVNDRNNIQIIASDRARLHKGQARLNFHRSVERPTTGMRSLSDPIGVVRADETGRWFPKETFNAVQPAIEFYSLF